MYPRLYLRRLGLLLAVVAALFVASCSSDGGFDSPSASLPFGDEPAVSTDAPATTAPAAGLDGIEELWADAGASEATAACYRSVLEDAGLGADIRTLEDLVEAQESLSDDQRAEFQSCV